MTDCDDEYLTLPEDDSYPDTCTSITTAYENKDMMTQIIELQLNKQDKLTAGSHITISGTTISASGFLDSVEWGDIEGTLADQTDLKAVLDAKQALLSAGIGITISSDNVISADTAFHAEVFSVLPTASESYKNTVGLVLYSGESAYRMYMCVLMSGNWTWVQVGQTSIDLSAYKVWTETKTYIDEADADLGDRIDSIEDEIGDVSEAGTIQYKIAQNASNITSEATTRASADTALSNRIPTIEKVGY